MKRLVEVISKLIDPGHVPVGNALIASTNSTTENILPKDSVFGVQFFKTIVNIMLMFMSRP